MTTRVCFATTVVLFLSVFFGVGLSQQRFPDDVMQRFIALSTGAETEGLRDPFVGITATGDPVS